MHYLYCNITAAQCNAVFGGVYSSGQYRSCPRHAHPGVSLLHPYWKVATELGQISPSAIGAQDRAVIPWPISKPAQLAPRRTQLLKCLHTAHINVSYDSNGVGLTFW